MKKSITIAITYVSLIACVLAIACISAIVCVLSKPTVAHAANLTAPGTADTSMSYNVDSTYTVVIPDSVTINQDGTGTMTVGVNEGALITYGTSIVVELTTCDFEITNNDDSLTYTIKDDTTATITEGSTVLTHGAGTLTASSEQLSIEIVDDAKYSGEYTDTVTFTVSVE